MDEKILIAYYSWNGNTKKIAETIQEFTDGHLFEIVPVQPYSDDYGEVVKKAKEEIRAGYLPDIKAVPDTKSYSKIFAGTPNWWSTMAPPLASFLAAADLKNKTVIPFLTHGGGGAGTFEKDTAAMCPDSLVTKAFTTYHSGDFSTPAELDKWLKAIGVK